MIMITSVAHLNTNIVVSIATKKNLINHKWISVLRQMDKRIKFNSLRILLNKYLTF